VHKFAPETEEGEEDVRGLLDKTFATVSSECAGSECITPHTRSTRFSMAVANSLADEHFSPEELLEMLETRDVNERLLRCEEVIQTSKKWTQTRKFLRYLF
jgi:hypothetical protein